MPKKTKVLAVMGAVAALGAVTIPARAAAAGRARGTLAVGSWKVQLSHAYAFADRDKSDPAKASYRVLVTNKALSAAAAKLAATAGADDGDRQQLAVELADQEVYGLQASVGAEKRVSRVDVYSPDSAMGMMVLAPTGFAATVFEADKIEGKLFTDTPIQDPRLGKPVQYEATFTAAVDRAVAR